MLLWHLFHNPCRDQNPPDVWKREMFLLCSFIQPGQSLFQFYPRIWKPGHCFVHVGAPLWVTVHGGHGPIREEKTFRSTSVLFYCAVAVSEFLLILWLVCFSIVTMWTQRLLQSRAEYPIDVPLVIERGSQSEPQMISDPHLRPTEQCVESHPGDVIQKLGGSYRVFF